MRVEYYKDKRGEWRWRLRHRNGNILADSAEGYTRRASAVRGWLRITIEILKDAARAG